MRTTVDGAPPGLSPESTNSAPRAIASGNAASTADDCVAGGAPGKLALVALSGRPKRRASSAAGDAPGRRTASEPSRATRPATLGAAGSAMLSPPGQSASAKARAKLGMAPATSAGHAE